MGSKLVRAREEVVWFASHAEWRAWLEQHHATETEIWVGIRKVHVSEGVSYAEAVDEALCFGWIDGITHTVDADGYTNRFTPRKPRSIWSAVNLKRIKELIAEGRVHESGMRAYEGRDPTRAGLYSFEQEKVSFDEPLLSRFQANDKAWSWFQSRPAGYRRQASWWVMSAKRQETRARRLAQLIDDSANERILKQFARN
jgi:uncharacterized protein YdeI (YjbR/CyaY-like superfamily)